MTVKGPRKFRGTIVQESLEDDRILNRFEHLSFRVTDDENPADRWHLFVVAGTEDEIKKLADFIKPTGWYAHFWEGDDVIAVFHNNTFMFKHSDKSTWKEAVEFGKSVGVPEEQLTFEIEE